MVDKRPDIIIKRVVLNRSGTWGVMIHDYQPFALTLEDPWNDNKKDVSCIPSGRYNCIKIYRKNKRYYTYLLLDVPGRTEIMFHPGNTKDDTWGCILIGEEFGKIKDKPALIASKRGFNEFMQKMKQKNSFIIEIRSPKEAF